MILKWNNLCSGTFLRNLVGLFVAITLWGTHVQGRRTDNRAVIARHRPFFSDDDNFSVAGESARQWFINPRRQKLDDASRRGDNNAAATAVAQGNQNVSAKTNNLIKSRDLSSRNDIHQVPANNTADNDVHNDDKSDANVTEESETSFSNANLNNKVDFSRRAGDNSRTVTAPYFTGDNLAKPPQNLIKNSSFTNTEVTKVLRDSDDSVQNNRSVVTSIIPSESHKRTYIDSLVTNKSSIDIHLIRNSVKSVFRNITSSNETDRVESVDVSRLASMTRRLGRQASAQEEGAEMIATCRKFVEGNPEKGEFYSPHFPNNYPNNTDCIKVLAASPGHLLRLDFRDAFHIEPSEGCRFDYLEVRDGAHGYENLIGSFCGPEFPPMMTSSGRFLWLRFHSDENIEYRGFSAVYESIPRPTTDGDHHELSECVIEVGGSEGFLRTTDIEAERRRIAVHYALSLECMWIVRVKPGWKIQLSFLKFELSKPNDCVSNFVDIFSDRTDIPSRIVSFCGSIADMVVSPGNTLHVRYLAEAKAINSSFEALFTAFRDSKVSACTHDEFDCQDETCISGELKCNGRINCRFRWDEDECKLKISPLEKILSSDHIIIILVVFSLIMFGMCFAFVFNCVRKLMHDHKIIKENFRASREGRLDELGIKLPASPRRASISSCPVVEATPPTSCPPDTELHGRRHEPSCYVPGAGDLMPILVGVAARVPANGDAVFMRDDDVDDDMDDMELANYPLPEMRDNECQTRESLFNTAERSVTPPPPPPPPVHRHNRPLIGQFSTFGYNRDNRREDPPPIVRDYPPPPNYQDPRMTKDSQRFRAEAVIEMDAAGTTRPFSVDSTKSAPDVIVTH